MIIPTLFVSLDETRMGGSESAQLYKLTELQWVFFFTCWRYNLDFYRNDASFHRKFNLGVPIYYYLLGRRMFGKAMKYSIMRLAHFPEKILKRRLYLDLREKSPLVAPQTVEIPQLKARPAIPALVD